MNEVDCSAYAETSSPFSSISSNNCQVKSSSNIGVELAHPSLRTGLDLSAKTTGRSLGTVYPSLWSGSDRYVSGHEAQLPARPLAIVGGPLQILHLLKHLWGPPLCGFVHRQSTCSIVAGGPEGCMGALDDWVTEAYPVGRLGGSNPTTRWG